jgi:hypothetical protein
VGNTARGAHKIIRIVVTVVIAINVVLALLLCFGVFKPRKSNAVEHSTPAPDPQTYAQPMKHSE